MTYNGHFMGPVLRARIGDRMQVHLVNDGPVTIPLRIPPAAVAPA